MTYKTAQRLSQVQLERITLHSIDLMKKRRISPSIVVELYKKTNDERIVSKVYYYLTKRVSEGDLSALKLVERLAEDESIPLGRRLSMIQLTCSAIELTPVVKKTAVRVFAIGMLSKNETLMEASAKGLMELAKRGEKDARFGLSQAATVRSRNMQLYASIGLNELAQRGVLQAEMGLSLCFTFSKDPLVIENAEKGIIALGKYGDSHVTVLLNDILARTVSQRQYEIIGILGNLAKSGDKKAYIGLNESLHSMDQTKRWHAITQFAELAKIGKVDESINALSKAVSDSSETNRRVAISALSEIAKTHPRKAFLPLATAVNDPVLINKSMAKKTLREIVSNYPEYGAKVKELKIQL